jgi:hypothetical protein
MIPKAFAMLGYETVLLTEALDSDNQRLSVLRVKVGFRLEYPYVVLERCTEFTHPKRCRRWCIVSDVEPILIPFLTVCEFENSKRLHFSQPSGTPVLTPTH